MPLYELVPPGSPGTEAALRRMTELAAKDARNWRFICIVSKIVSRVPSRDQPGELAALLKFYRGYVRYIPDPLTALKGYVELVQAPFRTLYRRGGDCDDTSTLMAASALALGMRPKFVVLKTNPKTPDEWSHVYCSVFAQGAWRGVDTTVASSYVGWEPEKYLARGEWRI
jgi:hypothetical protein